MAERLTTLVASNYACETLLSKSSDSTAGFANFPPAGDTSNLNAAPYIINSNDDVNPVIAGVVTFTDGVIAPGVRQVSLTPLTPVTVTATTPYSILSLFPAGFKSNCIVSVDGGGGFVVSSSGFLDNTGSTARVQGFNNTAIQSVANNGTATTTVNYSGISTNVGRTDLFINYFAPGGAATLPFAVTVQKLVGSN
jgi:hypothetical protein